MSDQDRSTLAAGGSNADRSLFAAEFDRGFDALHSGIKRLRAENERLRAVLEAAEAAEAALRHEHPSIIEGPCPACEAWPKLHAAMITFRQAEAER